MEGPNPKIFTARLKTRLPLFIVLAVATAAFFLASSLFLDDSYKDIILICMIWARPLFIH